MLLCPPTKGVLERNKLRVVLAPEEGSTRTAVLSFAGVPVDFDRKKPVAIWIRIASLCSMTVE
jgi:hypothetical protein